MNKTERQIYLEACHEVIEERTTSINKAIIKTGTTSLHIFIWVSLIYSFFRGVGYASGRGYAAYEDVEFQVIPREILGLYWLAVFFFLFWSLFVRNTFLWRISFLFASLGSGTWGTLFLIERGTRVIDGIITYYFLTAIFFVVAVLANDPRPIEMIREQVYDNDSVGRRS